MYKNILIPVDLAHGAVSKEISEIVRHLASDDATITFIHVVEAVPGFVAGQIPAEVFEDNERERRSTLADLVKASGLNATSRVLHGHPSTTILEFAGANKVDCIVTASHRPGLQDYFLGSTTARIVRHAKCSVHVQR